MKRVKVCEKSTAHTPAQIPCGFSPSMVPQPRVNRGSHLHRGSGAQKMTPGQGWWNLSPLDCGEMLSLQTSHQERSREPVTKALPVRGGAEGAKAAGSTRPPAQANRRETVT